MSKYGAVEICEKYGLSVRHGSDTPVQDSHFRKPGKVVKIKCVECGASRTIKPQDLFHTKRCVECQKKYRRSKNQKAQEWLEDKMARKAGGEI